MFYVNDISTDASTTEAAPKETYLRIWAGVIHRVDIMFPPGPIGLLHVTIWHGGHQIYPSNELQNFAADDETIRFNDFYKLNVGLNLITIKTWNEDTVNSHACRVRLGVLPQDIVAPYTIFMGIKDRLELLLRRIGVI